MTSDKKSPVGEAQVMYEFHDFLWIPNFIFKTVGYDFMRTSKSKAMRAFLMISLVLIVCCHIFCNYYMIRQLFFRFTIKENLMDIIRLASCIAYSVNSNVKFLASIINRKLAYHVFNTLQKAYPKTIEERKLYQINKFYWSRMERFIIVFYIIACWNVVYTPLAVSFYAYSRDNAFPYKKCYPIDYDYEYRFPLRYFWTYIIETAHSHYTITVNWGTDLWLMGLTAQICIHLAYIARTIEQYEPRMENSTQDCAFLVNLVQKHKIMLSLHSDLYKIFGISLVFNLISTTGVLCIVSVRLIVEGFGVEFLIFCTFLLTAIAQFYMVCYYGQCLIDMSQGISMAAYTHNWYNSSAAYKKLLLIVITRAQKQAELSAIGLQTLSLDTFKLLMEFAYRVFALLQTVLKL